LFLDDDREISSDTQTLTLERPQINITADSGRQNINNRTRSIHRNLYDQREIQNVPTTSSGNKSYFITFDNFTKIFPNIVHNVPVNIHSSYFYLIFEFIFT